MFKPSQARLNQLAKLYRRGRIPVLGLAALYVVMVLIQATVYAGFGLNTVSFAAQTLKADANDMAGELLRSAGLAHMRHAIRPLRYVLLCWPIDSGKGGRPPDAQRLAETQEAVIDQVTTHSGRVADLVYNQLAGGNNHMAIVMRPGDSQIVSVWGISDHRFQSCLMDKDNPARESGRIPASVIFKPSEVIHIPDKG